MVMDGDGTAVTLRTSSAIAGWIGTATAPALRHARERKTPAWLPWLAVN